MNHIKSLLGLISIVLAMMLLPLGTEAQTVAVPPGTDPSVKLFGQIYIETGNHVKATQNLDNIGNIAEGIANKYLDKIDINVILNDSDRSYIAKCMTYSIEQALRCSFKLEGIDPDKEPYFNQTLEEMSKQVERKLAGAKTVGDAVLALASASE